VLAEVGAVRGRQGHPALVVELALMRPNEHHSRLTTSQLGRPASTREMGRIRPRSPLAAIMDP
jgi:hypothetical protein